MMPAESSEMGGRTSRRTWQRGDVLLWDLAKSSQCSKDMKKFWKCSQAVSFHCPSNVQEKEGKDLQLNWHYAHQAVSFYCTHVDEKGRKESSAEFTLWMPSCFLCLSLHVQEKEGKDLQLNWHYAHQAVSFYCTHVDEKGRKESSAEFTLWMPSCFLCLSLHVQEKEGKDHQLNWHYAHQAVSFYCIHVDEKGRKESSAEFTLWMPSCFLCLSSHIQEKEGKDHQLNLYYMKSRSYSIEGFWSIKWMCYTSFWEKMQMNYVNKVPPWNPSVKKIVMH